MASGCTSTSLAASVLAWYLYLATLEGNSTMRLLGTALHYICSSLGLYHNDAPVLLAES